MGKLCVDGQEAQEGKLIRNCILRLEGLSPGLGAHFSHSVTFSTCLSKDSDGKLLQSHCKIFILL